MMRCRPARSALVSGQHHNPYLSLCEPHYVRCGLYTYLPPRALGGHGLARRAHLLGPHLGFRPHCLVW